MRPLAQILIVAAIVATASAADTPAPSPRTAAAAPTAAITAPAKVAPGNAVLLQTAGSHGASYYWRVFPAEYTAGFVPLTVYEGQDDAGKPLLRPVAFFSSTVPGRVTFILVAAEGDQAAIATHELDNGAGPAPTPAPDPTPTPPTPPNPYQPPTADQRAAIEPAARILRASTAPTRAEDARRLAALFSATGRYCAAAPELKTTADIRAANAQRGLAEFDAALKGRYPGLGAAIDAALLAMIGNKNETLTPASRAAAAAAFEAVAFMTYEAGAATP